MLISVCGLLLSILSLLIVWIWCGSLCVVRKLIFRLNGVLVLIVWVMVFDMLMCVVGG